MRLVHLLFLFLTSGFLLAQDPVQSFYLDLGPNDGTNGNATASPDANGNTWNNLTLPAGGETVTLVNTAGTASNYRVSLTTGMRGNGINHGGLLAPEAGLLGDLAIATATQDYFFTTTTGSIRIAGLDPTRTYRLGLFASRVNAETRITRYVVTGATTAEGELQSSGVGVGDGGYNGNNNTLYTTPELSPSVDGNIDVEVSLAAGSFAYLGMLRLEEFGAGGTVDVTSISIGGEDITEAGGTRQMTVTVLPANATFPSVSWSVDNPFVAIIDENGVLTALADGTVIVTASSNQPGTRVRAQKLVTVSGQNGRSILVDCGPDNGTQGNATPSPDAFGNTWNNYSNPNRSTPPLALVDAAGNATTWRLTTTQAMTARGLGRGGLETPPDTLLGNLGVATATQDYFFATSFGTLTISGLDPQRGYRLLAFGHRQDDEIQQSTYELGGLNGARTQVQTSGPGSGLGTANGNDNTLVVTDLVQPLPDSTLTITVRRTAGSSAYLNAFQLFEYEGFEICPEQDEELIVFMGSSVARGQGAPGDRGYAFQYTQLLEDRFQTGASDIDWTVNNVSVGGDNTPRILARFGTDLVDQCGRYVVIGLSLANEGIRNGDQRIFDQFQTNLLEIIARSRAVGLQPVIVSNYPRGDYDAQDYAFIQEMNRWIYRLDLPSVNVLGPVDDGTGRWIAQLQDDIGHPNLAGHEEFFSAFPPSLFDALAAGKPVPDYVETEGLRINRFGNDRQLSITPEEGLRSFSLALDFRTGGTETDLLAVGGLRVSIDDRGALNLWLPNGQNAPLVSPPVNDAEWHRMVLTYRAVGGELRLNVDGNGVSDLPNVALNVDDFRIAGNSGDAPLWLRNLLLYRANLNPGDIDLWNQDSLLRGSLEVYAPLSGESITDGGEYGNLAQTLNIVAGNFTVSSRETDVLAEQLTLSPNPTDGRIRVRHTAGERVAGVTVYDARGRVVLWAAGGDLDASALPGGVYTARVLVGDRTGVVRFVRR